MTSEDDYPTVLRRAGREYARAWGWRTVIDNGRLMLPMSQGVAALVVPRTALTSVIPMLKRLDCVCPCLSTPGEDGRLMILADWDGLIVSQNQVPRGARLALPNEMLPLPPTRLPSGVVRWIVAPHEGYRYLPTVSAVLMSIGLAAGVEPWR